MDEIFRMIEARINENGDIVRAEYKQGEFYVLVSENGYIEPQVRLDALYSLLTQGCSTLGKERIAEYNKANRIKQDAYYEYGERTTPIPNKKRKALYDETAGKCAYCGCALDIFTFHIEHIIPRAQKGSSEESNLIASCPSCNSLKKSMTPQEFAFFLLDEICVKGNKGLRHRYEACLVEADGVTTLGFAQQELIDKKLGV